MEICQGQASLSRRSSLSALPGQVQPRESDPLAAALALGARSTSVSTTYVTIVNPLNLDVNGFNGLML